MSVVSQHLSALAYCYQQISYPAIYKQRPSDFVVSEILDFDLTGDGEHLWVFIEKVNLTTPELIKLLGDLLKVAPRQIGYSGLKDKYGVTRQWLSLPLAQIKMPEEAILDALEKFSKKRLDCLLLGAQRHQKKCRIGCHDRNAFELRLRYSAEVDRSAVDQRVKLIADSGFPNYFTEQRFSRDNLSIFLSFRASRKRRRIPGILLSAARSYIFNLLLSDLIQQQKINLIESDDVLLLSGSNSYFRAESDDLLALSERLASADIKKALPMIGADVCDSYLAHPALAGDEAQRVGEKISHFADKTHYRAVLIKPEQLSSDWLEPDVLKIGFELPQGAYATALLRELGQVSDASRSG